MKTISQYICPYEFLGIAQEDLRGEELLSLRYMLEGEYRTHKTIRYKGRKISRKRALGIVEDLRDPKVRRYSWMIYRRPALKNFLETGEARWFLRLEPETNDLEKGFISYVSEFFAIRFDEYLNHLLQNGDYSLAVSAIAHKDWLDPADYYEAFQGARTFFWWRAKELELLGKKEGMMASDRNRYLHPEFLQCLAAMAAPFPSLTDYYVASLGEAIVPTVNKRKDFALASEILVKAKGQPVNADLDAALGVVQNQLREVIANAFPTRKFFMELIPIQSFRKGKWLLWQKERDRERTAGWIARGGIVFGLAMVVIMAFHHNNGQQAFGPKTKDHNGQLLARHQQTAPVNIFESLKMLAANPENAGAELSTSTPSTQPFASLLGTNEAKAPLSPEIAVVKNLSEKDIILFLSPQKPTRGGYYHIYVPAGGESTMRVQRLRQFKVSIYRGSGWKALNMPLPDGNILPGAFTCDVESPETLLSTDKKPAIFPLDFPRKDLHPYLEIH